MHLTVHLRKAYLNALTGCRRSSHDSDSISLSTLRCCFVSNAKQHFLVTVVAAVEILGLEPQWTETSDTRTGQPEETRQPMG